MVVCGQQGADLPHLQSAASLLSWNLEYEREALSGCSKLRTQEDCDLSCR